MLSTVQRPFILLMLKCTLRLILASTIPSSATIAAAFSHDIASQYPAISHLPTAATTPSLLSPLLMLPTPPPAGQQVSNSQHARPPPPSAAPRIGAPHEAITVAAFLLLSAFICGLAVGLANLMRSGETTYSRAKDSFIPTTTLFSPTALIRRRLRGKSYGQGRFGGGFTIRLGR
ncbi:hypothetical protein DFH08DRAFT_1088537 [Mycena albidolilacea]|uniref:Uncharacterized protein n=1 Tax=Mycena albidolilacea TaxID=1033008 RepID=A0AAD6Z5D7_9AGAR|nr:hypothetical protein DFH08DRAFT_1088537 [Mycena albidolilacea]